MPVMRTILVKAEDSPLNEVLWNGSHLTRDFMTDPSVTRHMDHLEGESQQSLSTVSMQRQRDPRQDFMNV